LTHIKGGAASVRNRRDMTSIADLLAETLAAARAAQWPVHRLHFAALRDVLCEQLAAGEEDLRIRLDTLNSAAPGADPEGYLAELEQLSALLRARGLPEGEMVARFVTLDLRGLQPPEPIVRIFDALEHAPGAPLRAILPHEPQPLYGLLRDRGFSCTGAPRADGGFEILIEPR
jgi:Uncharacterized conserved protein (DUF2249)